MASLDLSASRTSNEAVGEFAGPPVRTVFCDDDNPSTYSASSHSSKPEASVYPLLGRRLFILGMERQPFLMEIGVVACLVYEIPASVTAQSWPFRYVLLRLERKGLKDVWAGVFRSPPSRKRAQVLLGQGIKATNDFIMLSERKGDIILSHSHIKHELNLETPCPVTHLLHILRAMTSALDTYSLFNRNETMFSSILWQCMSLKTSASSQSAGPLIRGVTSRDHSRVLFILFVEKALSYRSTESLIRDIAPEGFSLPDPQGSLYSGLPCEALFSVGEFFQEELSEEPQLPESEEDTPPSTSDGVALMNTTHSSQRLTTSSSGPSLPIFLSVPHDTDAISIFSHRSFNSMINKAGSIFSIDTVDTVDWTSLPPHFSLPAFCDFVADHSSLQTARIAGCSGYSQRAQSGVTHRFLIVRLTRRRRRDVWLRLDRRRSPNVGTVAFMLYGGRTPSYDTAIVAESEEELLRNGNPPFKENELTFDSPYPLEGLRRMLLCVLVVMYQYRLASDNCWAFCSLLQENLVEYAKASFTIGTLKHPTLAIRARAEVTKLLVPLLHNQNPLAS